MNWYLGEKSEERRSDPLHRLQPSGAFFARGRLTMPEYINLIGFIGVALFLYRKKASIIEAQKG